MKIDFKFIDENNVIAEGSLKWTNRRPPPEDRVILTKSKVTDMFNNQYPDYNLESIEGRSRISNFLSLDESKTSWKLVVSKKQKPAAKPAVSKKRTYKKKTTKAGF